jgi:hypothetical protein
LYNGANVPSPVNPVVDVVNPLEFMIGTEGGNVVGGSVVGGSVVGGNVVGGNVVGGTYTFGIIYGFGG